jgi:hypothetical protein
MPEKQSQIRSFESFFFNEFSVPSMQVIGMNQDEINFFKQMVYEYQDVIEIFPALYHLNSQILVLDLLDHQREQVRNTQALRQMLHRQNN